MTFSVNGIKQEKNTKHTIEILVCVDAPLLVRKIISKTHILILSIKDFSGDIKTFGDIYFTIDYKFQSITIVIKDQDIQQAANFFTFMGFVITSINSFSHPLEAKAIAEIISSAKADAASKKEDVWKEIREKEDEERKVYQDVDLSSAKKVIEKVFEKIENIKKRTGVRISFQDKKELDEYIEELKKLRMGTNFEKIKETIQEIFRIIRKINQEYYTTIQNLDDTISPDSIVTSVDVEQGVETREEVSMLKSLHAKVSLNNIDYQIFGSAAMFWRFFQKDFVSKITDVTGVVYSIFDMVEFILIAIAALLGVTALANQIYYFSLNQYNFAYSLITLGIWGFLIFLARHYRKQNIGRLLFLTLLVIVLYHVVMWMMKTNFAI